MKGVTTQQGRETLNRFKMEAASEVGVNLKQGYNGDLTSREAGSVGGQMVKMKGPELQCMFPPRKLRANTAESAITYQIEIVA
jgi:hypothetical protein